MRCDVIAEGVVAASESGCRSRCRWWCMKGTNEALGKKILADSGLPIIAAHHDWPRPRAPWSRRPKLAANEHRLRKRATEEEESK